MCLWFTFISIFGRAARRNTKSHAQNLGGCLPFTFTWKLAVSADNASLRALPATKPRGAYLFFTCCTFVPYATTAQRVHT